MRKLYRSTSNRWFSGLCGGLAEHFGISSTLVRLLMVIAMFCSFGTTLLVYIVASLLTPRQSNIQFM
ncbi:PspC domain-containing protein [Paenibacillus piri]|uniref:PspC domain-containing protein n=1 Tax=Paenibacillus piri TaxID=2547395 RepID=A0A4R5KIL2_9BACL|nr:PspC domain-containing protein [Paenibacillus piri]TDF94110.1 PspC domain-containing protein [Paenibacillus piri]